MLKKLFKKDAGGFTLVELLVVMAIIAILITLIIIAIQSARRAQRDTQRRSNMQSIKTGLEAHFAANKMYPTAAQATLGGITGALGNYLSGTLSDPTGGNNRYCYAPQSNNSAYRLRMRPEGAGGAVTPNCAAAQAGDESFDIAP